MLIGLTGAARSGKDTVAAYISHALGGIGRYALASPIKQAVNDLFEWDYEHSDGALKEIDDPYWGFSPRKAYQLFGTEFGRGLRDDLWIHMANRIYVERGELIVTDVRFDNEAAWINRNGGTLIHVYRPEIEGLVRDHASEAGVDEQYINYRIINDTNLADLETKARGLAQKLA